jgi:hypothetical protein
VTALASAIHEAGTFQLCDEFPYLGWHVTLLAVLRATSQTVCAIATIQRTVSWQILAVRLLVSSNAVERRRAALSSAQRAQKEMARLLRACVDV